MDPVSTGVGALPQPHSFPPEVKEAMLLSRGTSPLEELLSAAEASASACSIYWGEND